MRKLLLSLLLLFCAACNTTPKKIIHVGVDPTFFPMELLGKEPAVLGFTNDILQEISRIEKVRLERVNMAWDTLIEGLQENRVQAIMSSMHPYNFNLKKYVFSDICLQTGPVLVVPVDSPITNFTQLKGAEVVTLSHNNAELLAEEAPGVIPRTGSNMSQAFIDLANGSYQAAFVEAIPARGYIKDLYQGKLKIVTTPQGDMGLRFITLHGENQEYIPLFNSGLNKLIKSGKYKEFMQKWNL